MSARNCENYSIARWYTRDNIPKLCGVNVGDATCSSASKRSAPIKYLQIAQSRREGKRVKQSIIATLGRLDKLTASGAIDQLLRSAARFAERLMVLAEHASDAHDSPHATVVSTGPALIFERLWRETGCQAVVRTLLATRHYHFDVDGGETLGQYGKSKDHRSDCKQMVLGMVIDGDGIPVASEMWPGNTTDVTTLDRVAERLQRRFGVRRVCLVADAGMISKKQIAAVEARGWLYILGARLRRTKEVRDVVLSDTGAFDTVEVERQRPDPMTLQVKEVTVEDTPRKGAVKAPPKPRRYVVCRNPDQARKDAATRAQLLAALEDKLRSDGPKSVVANKGYKRYLKAEKGAFAIDLDKARDEERFDGMWVLRTNTELSAVEVALRYKQLWMVEQVFRTAKSLLDTRPIFHKTDATICGHVFCSFLALVLRDELYRRMDNAGVRAEWGDILRDLNALSETTIAYNGKSFAVRSNAVGVAGKIAQCVGVRLPNTVRQLDIEEGHIDPGS